jgi:hypothetical protein
MSLPLWQPLRDAMSAEVRNAGDRAVTAFVTLALVVLALGFGVAAGLAALVPVMGFSGAALVFAALFAVMGLMVHLAGRARAARRAERIARARQRAMADFATLSTGARAARPLLPVLAFVLIFALMRGP